MRNVRTASWASSLTEEQSWQLYYKSRALRWNEAADWAVKEYGVEAPSRTAFYAWLAHMRVMESAHRLEQAATAAAEAAALAKTKTSDEAQIAAYKAMATELALRTGSAKEAEKFIQMAATLADKRLKAAEGAVGLRVRFFKTGEYEFGKACYKEHYGGQNAPLKNVLDPIFLRRRGFHT